MAKKTISPQTKLKIVLEVLKEERHVSEIAAEYEVHVEVLYTAGNKNCLKVPTKCTQAPRPIKRRLRPNGNKTEKLKTFMLKSAVLQPS